MYATKDDYEWDDVPLAPKRIKHDVAAHATEDDYDWGEDTKPQDDSWNITRGVKAGALSTAATIPAVGAMAAKTVGWQGGADAMVGAAQNLMAKAEQYQPDTSFGELIEDPSMGGAVDWAMYTIGNFAPSMVAGFGGAAAGAQVATKVYLKNAVLKGMAQGLTKEAAAKAVTDKVIKKIALRGAQTGIVGTTAGMEGGHMFMGDVEKHGLKDASVGKAVTLGGLAGLVELGIGGFGKGHMHLIEKYLGKAAKETAKEQPNLAIKMLSDIGTQSGGEAFQELTQEELAILHEAWTATPEERVEQDHWSRENWLRRAEAAAGGALIGVPGGMASSAIPTREEIPITTEIKEEKPSLTPLIGMIEEGLTAGELDGQPFSPEIAWSMMDEAYADKVLSMEDIDLLQERFPSLVEATRALADVKPEGIKPVAGKFTPEEKIYFGDIPEGKYPHLQKPRKEEPGISDIDAAEFEAEVLEELQAPGKEFAEFKKAEQEAKDYVQAKNKPTVESIRKKAKLDSRLSRMDKEYQRLQGKKRLKKKDKAFIDRYEKTKVEHKAFEDAYEAYEPTGPAEIVDKPVEPIKPIVPAKPITPVEPSKPEAKSGDKQRVAGQDAIITEIKTIEGVQHELYKTTEGEGVVRVLDVDSGEVVGIQTYPTYDTALKNYRKSDLPSAETDVKPSKEAIAPGNRIKFILNKKTDIPTEGIVRESVTSTAGKTGYNVIVPAEDGHQRTVRVWEDQGTIRILDKPVSQADEEKLRADQKEYAEYQRKESGMGKKPVKEKFVKEEIKEEIKEIKGTGEFYKLHGAGPQKFEMIRKLAREEADLKDESYHEVKNVKTGAVQIVESVDLVKIKNKVAEVEKPVKVEPKAEKKPISDEKALLVEDKVELGEVETVKEPWEMTEKAKAKPVEKAAPEAKPFEPDFSKMPLDFKVSTQIVDKQGVQSTIKAGTKASLTAKEALADIDEQIAAYEKILLCIE